MTLQQIQKELKFVDEQNERISLISNEEKRAKFRNEIYDEFEEPVWSAFLNQFILPLIEEGKFDEARNFTIDNYITDSISKFDILQFIRAKQQENK